METLRGFEREGKRYEAGGWVVGWTYSLQRVCRIALRNADNDLYVNMK